MVGKVWMSSLSYSAGCDALQSWKQRSNQCWQLALVPIHCTPELCLCTRNMGTTLSLMSEIILKSWLASELLTSVPFKDMLPESLNSVQMQRQRWRARFSLRWVFWFSTSAGLVVLRMQRLYPAQNIRRVLMAPVTSL